MNGRLLNATTSAFLLIFLTQIQSNIYGHLVNQTHVPLQRVIGNPPNPLLTPNIKLPEIIQRRPPLI